MLQPQYVNEGASVEAEAMGQMVYAQLLELLPAIYQWTLVTRPITGDSLVACKNCITLYFRTVEYLVWANQPYKDPERLDTLAFIGAQPLTESTRGGGVMFALIEEDLRRWFAMRRDPVLAPVCLVGALGLGMALIGTAWVNKMLVPNEHETRTRPR